MQDVLVVSRSWGRVSVTLRAVRMGSDLVVALSGGDRPHIGAVAVSQPRPSLMHPDVTSSSTSLITLLGHKEDTLARDVAGRLAAALEANVSVSCGIHLDDITKEEIGLVLQLTTEVVDELMSTLV